jgi:hypothetical protein
MRWNGRLIPIGFTSGEIPSLAMNLPRLKNHSIVGAVYRRLGRPISRRKGSGCGHGHGMGLRRQAAPAHRPRASARTGCRRADRHRGPQRAKDASFCECGGECCHSNVECGLVDAKLLAPLAPRRLPFLAIATNVGCLRETRT